MVTDATLLEVDSAESTVYEQGAVRLHVVEAGPEEGQPVVLLHGFPDFWYGWRHQIPALAEAGYRVLAVDQRGYNLSGKPVDVAAYRLDRLSADVAGLLESAGYGSAHVVGHDWGAAVAWDLALRRPAVVDRLGIVNVPHLEAFRRTLRSRPGQWLRSWYMLFFQLPRLPEWLLARKNGTMLARLLVESSRPGTFTDADLDAYRESWRQVGALRSMLNWYRAAVRGAASPFHGIPTPDRKIVEQPTLVVWGEEDPAFVSGVDERSVRYCPDGRLETFPDATHWVHMEESERVNELLLDHFS